MQISSLPAAATVATDESAGLDRQLAAFQGLMGRWRDATASERPGLAQALNDLPFAQRAQATLDAFTRAAWAGPDAVPPEPQARMLQAFDSMPAADQKIVAALQGQAAPKDYRARLQADLQDATPQPPERRVDTVTLSAEAQARLAGAATPQVTPLEAPANPQIAAALAAYARVAGG